MAALKKLETMKGGFDPGYLKKLMANPKLLTENLSPDFLKLPQIEEAKAMLEAKANLNYDLTQIRETIEAKKNEAMGSLNGILTQVSAFDPAVIQRLVAKPDILPKDIEAAGMNNLPGMSAVSTILKAKEEASLKLKEFQNTYDGIKNEALSLLGGIRDKAPNRQLADLPDLSNDHLPTEYLEKLVEDPNLPVETLSQEVRDRPDVRQLLQKVSEQKAALAKVTEFTNLVAEKQRAASAALAEVKAVSSAISTAFDPTTLDTMLGDPTALAAKLPEQIRSRPEFQQAVTVLNARKATMDQVQGIESTIREKQDQAGRLLRTVQNVANVPSYMAELVGNPDMLLQQINNNATKGPEFQQAMTLLREKELLEQTKEQNQKTLADAEKREEEAKAEKAKILQEHAVSALLGRKLFWLRRTDSMI